MMKIQQNNTNSQEFKVQIEIETGVLANRIMGELVAERKHQGKTQQEIADMTGMKAPNIARIEACRFTPTLEVLIRYAKAVGKEIHFVLKDASDN